MRQELEQRREILLKRRDVNLERHSQLDKVRKAQGVTKSWVFSYFIRWPKENYEKYVFFFFYINIILFNKILYTEYISIKLITILIIISYL